MKDREERIAFQMQYCQHYRRGKGADMVCTAGMDLKTMQRVPTGPKGIKWGPCIDGHTLENPTQHCPHWIRRNREEGERYADSVERSIKRMAVVMPFVNEWRKKLPLGKAEVVECPACNGRLHLSQAPDNGHVRAKCETDGCVAWME